MLPDKPIQAFVSKLTKSSFGQTARLFFWPCIAVIPALAVLYLDGASTIKQSAVHIAVAETQSAARLLDADGTGIVSDLSLLAQSETVHAGLIEATPRSRRSIVELFQHVLKRKPRYERISLLDDRGVPLCAVEQGGGMLALAPPSSKTEAGPENRYLKDVLGNSQGRVYSYPPIMMFHAREASGDPGPALRFGAKVQGDRIVPVGIVEIRYRVADLLGGSQGGIDDAVRIFLINAGWYDRNVGAGRTGTEIVPDFANAFTESFGPGDTVPPAVLEELRRGGTGSMIHDGGLFAYFEGKTEVSGQGDSERWFIVSKIPATYFHSRNRRYMEFLFILAAALLVPSFIVGVFLSRERLKNKKETESFYRRQSRILSELEEEINQRTRELDERNLQLSAEIAERLNTEKRLQQSNELLSGMLDSIDGIIYVADFDSHEILFANDYLKNLFGFEPVGKPCWQFIHSSKNGPCFFCANHMLLNENGEPEEPYLWEYQNPFNKKWYAAKDQAIRWSDGRYVKLEIAVDITEQKRLQHFLSEARKQADLATAIRNRFVALVAHDLKSPFYSMTRMLKRILERETFSHRVHEQFLENIVNNGQRMLHMIDNLLSMDRFEAGDIKLEQTFFNVSKMADEVLGNFTHTAFEKGIRLGNSIPDTTMLYADKYLYFVVLNNLVSNAIKFTEYGGIIEIFRHDSTKSTMTIGVKDSGEGMSEEFAANLFKADVKTSSRGTKGEQGTGLGLIFCREIIEAHAGTIGVESEPGVGTTFYIILPESCKLGDGTARAMHSGNDLDNGDY